MSTRLSGLNPLSYTGVEPNQPPLLVQYPQVPTTHDFNFNVGTFWLVKNTQQIWMLSSVVSSVATWILLFPGAGGGAGTFPTNVGTAVAVGGVLNVLGSGHVTTTGVGNTVTASIDDSIASAFVTDSGTVTPQLGLLGIVGGALITTSNILGPHTAQIFLDDGIAGQVIIGGGSQPHYNFITSSTMTITPGVNTLDFVVNSPIGATQLTADVGIATFNAGSINIFSGTNINTTGDSASTIHVNLNNSVSLAGSLTTSGTVTSGTGLTVTAGGIDSTGPTHLNSLGAGVMQTNAGGVVSSNNGTNGQLLISSTAGVPAWANITSADGSVTVTNGPNSINLSASHGVTRNAFLAYTNANWNLPTSAPGVIPMTILFDTGGNFSLGGGIPVYTAPITGLYCFQMMVSFQSSAPFIGTTFCVAFLEFNSYRPYPNRILTYRHKEFFDYAAPVPGVQPNFPFNTIFQTVTMPLIAGDTVYFSAYASSLVTLQGFGGAASTIKSYISGFLVQPM